jgi:hypothetical protein
MEHSQIQHLAASKQMMMLLQKVTSHLAIQTALDKKKSVEGGGGRVERGVETSVGAAGGTSFRRQRGVRAKRGESIKKAKPNHSYESSDRSTWLKQRYQRINTSDLSSDESGDSGRYSISSEACGSSDGKSNELAGRGVGEVREGWMGGQVSDTNKWMSQPYVNCKISDEKMVNDRATDNKVVIIIDIEDKHQIKQSQRAKYRKQPMDSKVDVLQSKTSLPDTFQRMTIHVPCVDQEEIFNVWM